MPAGGEFGLGIHVIGFAKIMGDVGDAARGVLLFFVVSIAVIVLRRTNPDMKRPFRVPFSPFVPALSAVLCLGMMASLATETWIRFVVWLAIGLAIYFGYGKRHSHLATGEASVAQETLQH